MKPTVGRLSKILGSQGRRQFAGLVVLATVAGLFQVIGVSTVLPFMTLATNPQLAQTQPAALWLRHQFGLSAEGCVAFTGGLLVVTIALSNLINAVTTYYTLKFGADCRTRFSVRLLRNYSQKDYLFFLENNTAILNRNLLDQTYTLVTDFITAGASLAVNLVSILALLIALVWADPVVALITGSLFSGGYLCIYSLCHNFLKGLGTETARVEEERYKIATELLTCQREARLLHCQETFIERFQGATAYSAWAGIWSGVISQIPRQVLETLGFLVTAGLVCFYLWLGHPLSSFLPKMSLYIVCAVRLLPQLQLLFATLTRLRFSNETLEILHADLSYESGPLLLHPPTELDWQHQIRLQDLSYRYPSSQRLILDGLSLEIPRNSSVGFVGVTGAGKTTLINILLGLLVPTEGQILVDSQPVTRENLPNWQAGLGFVPQDIVLIDDTLAANIAFGARPSEVVMADVQQAARLAQLDSFIQELPDGLDSQVGERGLRLSGGQRQRLGIARALYRNPSIILFDEATSALDGVTERAVMDAVASLGGTKTLILIAHRLSTLKSCDKIFLLENGQVVDTGTYAELLARNETFREFAR